MSGKTNGSFQSVFVYTSDLLRDFTIRFFVMVFNMDKSL